LIAPVFGKDIGWVEFTREMRYIEMYLAAITRWKDRALWLQLGVWDGSTINHGLIVAKHKTLIMDWDPKVTKTVAKIDYLVNACTAGNEFRTVGSCLNSCLLLGVPVNGSLVEEMKKAGDGATCKHVMIKVSIKIVSKSDVLAKQSRCVGRNEKKN
jgi:hypothetical protein